MKAQVSRVQRKKKKANEVIFITGFLQTNKEEGGANGNGVGLFLQERRGSKLATFKGMLVAG